jgi:hypothetical protein
VLGAHTGCAPEAAPQTATSVAATPAPTATAPAPGAKVASVRPPSVQADALVRKVARWLPADTDLVITMDAQSSTDVINFWRINGDAPRAAKVRDRFDKLVAELDVLSGERLGMRFMNANAVVLGLSSKSEQVTVVVVGATVDAKDTTEVGDASIFKLVPRHPADAAELTELADTPEAERPYGLAIPDGSGVVLSTRGILETIAASKDASFAGAGDLDGFAKALSGAPSHFSVAVGAEFFKEMELQEELGDLPLPTLGVLAVNERTSFGSLTAPAATLDKLNAEYTEAMAEAGKKAKDAYAKRNDSNAGEAAVAIMAYHGHAAMEESVKVERADGAITFEVSNSSLGQLSSFSSLLADDDLDDLSGVDP